MKLISFIKSRERWSSYFLVIVVTLLTYAPVINRLGFYRDDWYLVWTYESQGVQGLLNLFAGDRPFLGWIYVFDFHLLGSYPLYWHIYALLLKVISGLAVLWLLGQLWPDRKVENVFITLLFVVYPGFYQQPNALTFKQLLLAYAASLLSIAFTFRAIRSGKVLHRTLFMILALVLSIFYMLIYEALVGMEAVRFILICRFFYQKNTKWKESLRSAVGWFTPFFMFSLLFVIWRLFVFQSTRKATSVDVIAQGYSSLHGFVRLFIEVFKDIIESTLLAWSVPYYQFTVSARYRDMGLAFGMAALVVALSVGYYILMSKQVDVDQGQANPTMDWLVLGLGIVFFTTLPVVVAGRNAIFAIQWDRYTYQASFGVALLIGGFVFYLLHSRIRLIVLFLLIGSGVITQSFSAMYYRDFWTVEREAWWQLYWRAPQIVDGSTVIASLPGAYQLAEEYEIWGPINLLYHRGEPLRISGQVPFDKLLVELERGLQEERLVRGTVLVKRNYGQSLIISIPDNNSCLHVYDGALGLPLQETSDIRSIAPYSRTDWILTDVSPPNPPVEIFGDEPVRNWCFYYQKIELALQARDWTMAARLADEAIAGDFRPNVSAEWLPVLFAYANSDRAEELRRASKFIDDKYTRWYLCLQLRDVPEWPQGYKTDLVMDNLCFVQ